MLLLFTASAVFAQQDIVGTITNLIIQFSGVIFIIVFILILMLIAGVFPKVKLGGLGGMPWGSILLLILIALLFLIPQFIAYPVDLSVPDSFKVYELPSQAVDVLAMIGLPREWVSYVPAVIYMFVLPFAAIFALVWAFLASLALFTHVGANINRLLAFIIAFMTIPVGWYVKMVWVLFSFMGAWSVAVFAAVFIVGVFYRGAGIVAKERMLYKQYIGTAKQVYREVLGELSDLKDAPLEQMKEGVNRILNLYGSQLPTGATSALHSVAKAEDAKQGSKLIEDAIYFLKKSMK